MLVMLLWVYIHTEQAWKICQTTVGIEPTTFGIQVDYFRLFYEYFEEKVSDFLFIKSGSVITFF
jgi:hypothetical protein